jgi:dienelactone hydrolase
MACRGRRRATPFHALVLAALVLSGLPGGSVAAQTPPAAIPPGTSAMDATIGGTPLRIYTYRPEGCPIRTLLLVFHGVGRNADGYRDHAIPLADATCGVVVAPLFDRARFPTNIYQHGGVADAAGNAVPSGRRSIDLVAPLAAWGRAATGAPSQGADLRLVLIGHSAGAQFLSRVAAFAPPPGAAAFVIVNPSSWVMPSAETRIPFGFGGLGSQAASEQALKAYLALPITALLGEADEGTFELEMDAPAMTQGANRLARGRNAFRSASETAAQHGWAFGWRLSEIPGVGHSAAKMFASPQAVFALSPRSPAAN